MYYLLFPSPKTHLEHGVDVFFYDVKLKIYDIDAALGYVFSACPLPHNATPVNTYLPLLAIYCKFMALLIIQGTPNMNEFPKTACIVVGVPRGSGGIKAIMFGATIRGEKSVIQPLRRRLLEDAYGQVGFPKNPIKPQYGHCAETYPFICNLDRYVLHCVLTLSGTRS